MRIVLRIIKTSVLVAVFAALIAFGGWIQIPFRPLIPFSLQVLFVLLTGAVLGPLWGSLSVVLYLAAGLPLLGLQSFFGLPLFTSGPAALGALIEEGGGYLWGYLLATIVIGFLLKRAKRPDFYRILFAMIAGLLIIYAFGTVQYLIISKASPVKLVQFSIPAFFAADILKAIVAALIATRLRSLLKAASK